MNLSPILETKKFKSGDRVVVSRIKPRVGEPTFDDPDYPKIGWTGTLNCFSAYSPVYHLSHSPSEHKKWVINWDATTHVRLGDLIWEWMITPEEWDRKENS